MCNSFFKKQNTDTHTDTHKHERTLWHKHTHSLKESLENVLLNEMHNIT